MTPTTMRDQPAVSRRILQASFLPSSPSIPPPVPDFVDYPLRGGSKPRVASLLKFPW